MSENNNTELQVLSSFNLVAQLMIVAEHYQCEIPFLTFVYLYKLIH